MSHLLRPAMKAISAFCLLCTIFLIYGCSQRGEMAFFTSNDLNAVEYEINTGEDTVLTTAKGAMISIPRGALSASTRIIKLKIREAYTIADMIKGGLVTRSGKEPLSSGGMIEITTADGGNLAFAKPVLVSLPTDRIVLGMQLFKGVRGAGGIVNWVDPGPLINAADNSQAQVAAGKLLYNKNCAACHHPTWETTGPPLAFLNRRRDKTWLMRYIHNPSDMIAGSDVSTGDTGSFPPDPYALCLYEHYNKTSMTAFPDLSEEDVDNIFRYLDDETKDVPLSAVRDNKAAFDSCRTYNRLIAEMKQKRDSLVANNGKALNAVMTERPADAPDESGGLPKPEGMVAFSAEAQTQKAEYYQFNIRTTGWYNVDILISSRPWFRNSELITTISGGYSGNYNLFMVLPESKIFLNGGKIAGEQDKYGFYTDDGMILLPPSEKGIVFAVCQDAEKLYFGDVHFTTGTRVLVNIMMRPVSRREIDSIVSTYHFQGVSFDLDMSKNANEIGKIDSLLQKVQGWLPTDWNCDCGSR